MESHNNSAKADPSQPNPLPSVQPLAVVSLVVGVLALLPVLLIVAGLPALVLGYISLRLINGSQGRWRGGWLAIAAMVLGGLTSLFSVSGCIVSLVIETRNKADVLGCQNNLRLIGLATSVYHDGHDHYPRAAIVNPNLSPDERLSWLAAILPDLATVETREAKQANPTGEVPPHAADLGTLYSSLDVAKAWNAEANRIAINTQITEYVCPSYGDRAASGTPALTTYVGFAGVGDDAATLPLDDPRAGFFGYERVLTRKTLHDMRGESNTAVATETAFENGPWAAGGPPTVRGLPVVEPFCIGPGRPYGGIHRTGANILFADGSVRFFKNEYESEKLQSLVVIRPE